MTQKKLSEMIEEFQSSLSAGETGAIVFGSQYLKPETAKMMGLDNMMKLYTPCSSNNETFNKKSN